MPTIVALDNEFATVSIHPEKRIVHHKFKKYIYGEAFRETLSTGAGLMEKYKATKWLSDDRNNAALPKNDADWATSVWFPRVRKAGWKTWAVVLPQMVVGQMNMQGFVDQYLKQGIVVRVFTSADEAMAWLESV